MLNKLTILLLCILILFAFFLTLLLNLKTFVQFAMKFEILLTFLKFTVGQLNFQNGGLNWQIKIQLDFRFALSHKTSDFDRVCCRLHGLIRHNKALHFRFSCVQWLCLLSLKKFNTFLMTSLFAIVWEAI